MSFRTLATAAVLCAAFAVSMSAQQRQPPAGGRAPAAPVAPAAPAAPATLPATAAPPPPPPAPRSTAKPVNVKIDFNITDNRGTEAPIKRSVSVIAADQNLGRVRSTSQVLFRGTIHDVPLYVDATPTVQADGKVKVQFTLSYDWPAPAPNADNPAPNVPFLTSANLSDSVSLFLEDGKSMIAAQSADPIGDRQVTVEVKATVLK